MNECPEAKDANYNVVYLSHKGGLVPVSLLYSKAGDEWEVLLAKYDSVIPWAKSTRIYSPA